MVFFLESVLTAFRAFLAGISAIRLHEYIVNGEVEDLTFAIVFLVLLLTVKREG